MAVYLTKSILSRLNKVSYQANTFADEDASNSSGDHWNKLFLEGGNTVHLATDMICRVCGRSGTTPIAESFGSCDIMGAICSISNVTMSTDDSLPKYICSDCLDSLRVALRFKKTCESSDKKFKQILNPHGDPSFHSYPYSKHDFQLILHQMKSKRLQLEKEKEKERVRKEKLKKKNSVPKAKQFTCSPCDLSFPSKDKLLAHRRERQCMRRACELCGQLVLSIAQHMRHIHKQTVPHKCPTCGKEFPIIARLRNHMLVHTNTFNFFCDLCPYKCKHKYYLVMHMRTHTGEKPYKCLECPATFVNPSNLNKHKLTHQEKRFKCMLCEKAFRTPSALREHHDATHMNIKHTCNYCGRDFCYKSDLRKHEIRSHNRIKRDYVGGEPSYKQVERLQKMQEENDMDKWSEVPLLVSQQTTVPSMQTTYTIETNKEFVTTSQPIYYFSDVTAVIQQPTIVQTQPVQVQVQPAGNTPMPDINLKKDEVKLYETQQGIGYF